MPRKISLYRIEPTYAGSVLLPYWSTSPACNATDPDTGLEYDEWTDGGPVEFVLPDHVSFDDEMGMLYDERDGQYLRINELGGEPSVCIPLPTTSVTNTGDTIETEGLFNVVLKRA